MFATRAIEQIVIASDSEAIQTEPQLETPSLGRLALLAMTDGRGFLTGPQTAESLTDGEFGDGVNFRDLSAAVPRR